MKAILEVNLAAPLDKNAYSLAKKSIILSTEPPTLYSVDEICYSARDAHESILHDIVIGYSEQKHKEEASYSVLFDKISEQQSARQFIRCLSELEVFKKQDIRIGHFLIHGNGIFDYFSERKDNSASERSEMPDTNSSLEQNFQYLYKREINLCEELKLMHVPELPQTIAYVSKAQFFDPYYKKNCSPTLQMRQLENKKVLEFYIVKIGPHLAVNMILLNHNKNYGWAPEEKKELAYCLMMYGSDLGAIKYSTIKAEAVNTFLKSIKKLFYYGTFPGPEIQQSQPRCGSGVPRMRNEGILSVKSNASSNMGCSGRFHPPGTSERNKKSGHSNSNGDNLELKEYFDRFFYNLSCLNVKDKEVQQNIIKQYLEAKEKTLKNELDRANERVRELQHIHRVELALVSDVKAKMLKHLQKSSRNILELKKMGIQNVEKHMIWMQATAEEKKNSIKEEQQQIEAINHRIIQSRRNHEYFVEKMIGYRDRLKAKKQTLTTNSNRKQNSLLSTFYPQSTFPNENSNTFGKLTDVQLDLLEQFRQNLKEKTRARLKNSQERKTFMDNMDEIRKKASKLEIAKLEQKYFELFHE